MLVFVYGTLKVGHHNHGALQGASFVGDLEMWLPYKMVDCGYFPALVPSEDTHYITGEVYNVNEDMLQHLDRLEGYPDLYQKDTLDTPLGDVIVYVMREPIREYNQIKTGHWPTPHTYP